MSGPLSKIEKAGENVVEHIMQLARDTDSVSAIAKRINTLYDLDLSPNNIWHFLKTNQKLFLQEYETKVFFEKLRSKLYLRHVGLMVKDSKDIDEGIKALKENEFLEDDKKWGKIGELIDKRGRLLIRHARLTGKLETGNKNVVNIGQQVNIERSDIAKRLRKANFKPALEEAIDVKAEVKDENTPTNP